GSNSNMEVTDDGMIFMTGGDDLDGGGRYWGEGIPIANNGGLHYENKWKNDKHSLNTNYKVGALNVKTEKNTINQNNLTDGIINTNSDDNKESDMFRQKIDATYNIKLDTSSNLKIIVDGTLKNTESESIFYAESTQTPKDSNESYRLNTSDRRTTNDAKQQLFNLNALYTKKLKKPGRNYSVNLTQAYNKNNSDGYLRSDNNFYNEDGTFARNELIDQLKDNDIIINRLATNFTYNEPLSKFFNLVANYNVSLTNNNAHKRTFDASAPNRYDQLNAEFSNNFQADQLINQVGAIFNYKKGKTVVNFGTKTSFVNFDQIEKYSNQTFNRNFINWLPQAMYQYKFSAQKSLSINYNGSTTQPTVNQLQPVRTNDDPLNIPEGNPLLEPAYNNRFYMRYNTYKVLTNQNFYVNGSFNFVNNAIVSSNITDQEGRTIYRSVNLENSTPINYNTYIGFSRKVKFLGDVNAGLNLSLNGSNNYNYVFDRPTGTTQLNKTTNLNVGPSLNISKYAEKTQFYFSFGPRYTSQEASVQRNVNNAGWGANGYFDAQIKLPKKITIWANSEYTYQPSTQSFDSSFERFIINATVTKAFFKQESLKFSVSANDILNENVGFSRFASGSSIIQTSYNNISRYFMFSLIWDFNRMGGGAPKAN
ncbi:MAG: outer membrane beta-barrel protein, partial [Pedobacter sp.]